LETDKVPTGSCIRSERASERRTAKPVSQKPGFFILASGDIAAATPGRHLPGSHLTWALTICDFGELPTQAAATHDPDDQRISRRSVVERLTFQPRELVMPFIPAPRLNGRRR
jgi:hypothetical protein